MSRYSQYGYYDPVGSSQPQPTGYTYGTSSNPPSHSSATTTSDYGSNQQGYGNSGYNTQSYGSNAQSNTPTTNHAAAALSSLGNQDYNQTSNQSSTGAYDNNQWYGSNATGNYGASNLQPPNRSQANNSPLYASTQASTFDRVSIPEQSQSTSSSYGSSSTYQNAPSNAGANYRYQNNTTQTVQNPPQRYNSPLHAVQAQQQSHQKRASRGSNHQPSPLMTNAARHMQQSRQQSASVEPSITVDPSQVYDNRAELERKARFEAEKRKKIEAEQAAKKAEEDRLAEEKRKTEEAEKKAAEKKEAQDRKNEQRRKAREEKRQSKSAATTLQQMASMGAESSAAGGGDDEAEMRAMFAKMREFNSKNPAMLAKLWEEERTQHAQSQSPPAPAQKAKPPPAPAATKNTHSRQSAAQAQPKSAAPPTKVLPSQQPTVQQAKSMIANSASPSGTPSRPAASSSSTTLWPPHKKGALADATAKWLMVLPENAGKTISQQAVLDILNTNPSYVQLCESLENLDMKFERSTLARELLKAVPDGLRSQPKPATPVATIGTISSAASASRSTSQSSAAQRKPSAGAGTVTYSTPLSLSDAAREVNQMHKSGPQYGGGAQYGGGLQGLQQSPQVSQFQTSTNGSRPPSQARAPSQSQPPEVKTEVQQPPEPRREPADKEEAARKRTFGDLVDLTAEDESEDEGPPAKKYFVLPSTADSNGLSSQQQKQQPPAKQSYQPFSYQSKNQVPGAGLTNPSHQNRPTQIVPSNYQGAQAQPTPIAQAPPKPKGPSNESIQQARMRGRMLVEPIMRDRVARKSRYDSTTIARDVLLATGRHPDMRGLNHHLHTMQKLLGHHGGEVDSGTGTKCDLSTIRWDIIDPDQPVESVEEPTVETKIKEASRDPEATVSIVEAPAQQKSSTVNYEAPFTIDAGAASAPSKFNRKRGPGRPRMFESGAALGERGSPANATSTPNRTTPRDNTPIDPVLPSRSNDMAATGTPVGYAAFREIGPDGQIIKKKGRPVGWKKSIHSREAQGLPPHYPKKAGYQKDTGTEKLDRRTLEAKEKLIVESQWQSFRCEWKDCKADLQNSDVLKKHLLKVHGREINDGRGKGFECRWRGCDRQPGEGERFGQLEEWLGHVHKAHLELIAWRQGDGPRGGSLGENPFYRAANSSDARSSNSAYLNDAYGRSVTPIISPTPPPQAKQGDQQAQAPTAAMGQLGLNGQQIGKTEAAAEAELEKLRVHKGIVGATMDRQGAIFASHERRATFLGDEDFETVVDASDGEDSVWP